MVLNAFDLIITTSPSVIERENERENREKEREEREKRRERIRE